MSKLINRTITKGKSGVLTSSQNGDDVIRQIYSGDNKTFKLISELDNNSDQKTTPSKGN